VLLKEVREVAKRKESYEHAKIHFPLPGKNNIAREGSMLVSGRPDYYGVNSTDFYSMDYTFDSLPIY
jgi:hypothetical protein